VDNTIPLPAVNWRLMAIPVVVDYAKISREIPHGRIYWAWRALYVFGIRVAAWRMPPK